MQRTQIKRVTVEGLHGSQDLSVSLRPGLSLIHGKNGSGKTTLLHIIANLAERDIERFCHIKFNKITVETTSDSKIELRQLSFGEKSSVEIFIDKQALGVVNSGEETPPAVSLVLKERLGGRPVYLPAFRSILEATSRSLGYYRDEVREKFIDKIIDREVAELSSERKTTRWQITSGRERARAIAQKTLLCREWFGAFVPLVRSPSLIDVSEEIQSELQQAQLEIAASEREALSEVFIQAMQAALNEGQTEPQEDAQTLLHSVQNHLTQFEQTSARGLDREIGIVYSKLREMIQAQTTQGASVEARVKRILKVYETALRSRKLAQEKAFQQIRTFETSVNRFLQGKKLLLGSEAPRRARGDLPGQVLTTHDHRRHSFFVLSSGERHVLTLLFSATHMAPTDGIVLIDEPELSLHVEWQRIILTELIKQSGDRQVLACTHSPEVAAEHRDMLVPLKTMGTTPGPTEGDQADASDEEA